MSAKKITLNVREVAEMLGVAKTTIYAMVREKQIPYFRARGRVLFNRQVIEEFTKGEYELENESVS